MTSYWSARRKSDPEFRARDRAANNSRKAVRWQNDPDYRAQKLARERRRYQERMSTDFDFRSRKEQSNGPKARERRARREIDRMVMELENVLDARHVFAQ